jgi:outer membrane protein OmpA-like peptidoglycan-associated protein
MKPLEQWTRMGMILALCVCLTAAGAAAGPGETPKPTEKEKSADKAKAGKAEAAKKSPARSTPAEAATTPPKPQGGGADSGSESDYVRIPSTVGPLGLFTQETGELMPSKSFAFAGYADKFSRMPGHTTILNVGWNLSVGFHDRFNVHIQFDPHRYLKVQRPNQLSLRSPTTNPQFGQTIYRSLLPIMGVAPAYVEDYPFVNRNDGGAGEVALGLRFALAQERLGNLLNLSVGYDFFLPTQTQLDDLLDNQAQLGTFAHGPRVSASKTVADWLLLTLNTSYKFTRNHEFGNPFPAFEMADQFRVGGGILLFPQYRWQLINEYNALMFVGDSTPNTTFGARAPVDGIWGARLYFTPYNNLALDVGYRRMLNLKGHGDPNGFVVKLGLVHWGVKPPPPNRDPSASCTADKSSVIAGSGESIRVMMRASDPDGDTLSYSWSANGGRVDGSGADVTWNPGNAGPGMYTITGSTADGRGGTASCSVEVRVEPKPNRGPSLTCSAERRTVQPGERVRITGQGSDPDGDALTYSWRANAGQIVGSGSTVQWDSSGLRPGNYQVTGRVEDPKGLAADCSVQVGIEEPPPPPQASKLNECFFRQSSARVDNVCKRILDDVALRLQNDPRARVVIVGYADPKEPRPERLAGQRADATKKYLGEKGIAATRVDVRTAGGQAGAGRQNQRVDVVWVPEGATY